MEKLVGWGEVSGDQVELGQDNSLETLRASETLPGGWSVRQSPCATEKMNLLGGVWRQEKISEGWSIENNDPNDTPVYSPATQTNNREVSENKAKPTAGKTKTKSMVVRESDPCDEMFVVMKKKKKSRCCFIFRQLTIVLHIDPGSKDEIYLY